MSQPDAIGKQHSAHGHQDAGDSVPPFWTGDAATDLTPLPLPPATRQSLGERLLARVRQSARAHRDFVVVRRDDGPWLADSTPGATRRTVLDGALFRLQMMTLEAGVALPWPADAHGLEVLVLSGALQVHSTEAASPGPVLAMHDHAVQLREASRPLVAAERSDLYVRVLKVDAHTLPQGEAQWWLSAQAAPSFCGSAECPWVPVAPGLESLNLKAEAGMASMLVKLAPGARIFDHGHAVNEDCVMLDGDVFQGDILLRKGDFQLAPAGVDHVNAWSDTGALFYFHGALPVPI